MELKGAEIFDVGTWNGITFTDDDLNQIVAAFDELGLGGRVPLKYGHTGKDAREDDTQPALGWVQRVYRRGKKLVADFADIPAKVAEQIKSGGYKFVSIELLRDVKAGASRLPWVLDAVALLGAARPAVDTLAPLSLKRLALVGERITFSLQEASDDMSELKALNKRAAALYFENQITAGRILPRDREAFFRRYGDDATLADAEAWVRETPRAPSSNARSSFTGSGATAATGERVDVTLARMVDEEIEEARKTGLKLDQMQASLRVFKKAPELAQAWKFIPGEK
jgi:hypothetical protein